MKIKLDIVFIFFNNRRVIQRHDGKRPTEFGDLTVTYKTNFLDYTQEQETLHALQECLWSRVEYPMYGKTRRTPRHTWCFGRLEQDRGKNFQTELFQEWLETIRVKVEETTGFQANACILNMYINGEDHITWHADDEKFLKEKTVVSLSFGHPREFCMRNNSIIHKINLQHNSILIMKNGIEHSLPASKSPVKTRYNITFRQIVSEKGMGNYYYYNRGLEHFL